MAFKINNFFPYNYLSFIQVNNVDFGHFTREEAANFLLDIKKGEQVAICTQHKMDSKFIPNDDYYG